MKKFVIMLFTAVVFVMFGNVANAVVEGTWQFPKNIKTYIPSNNKNSVMMRHAFEEWERATNHNIDFDFVSSPGIAKIRVNFVSKIDNRQNKQNLDRAIGLAQTFNSSRNKRLYRANIWIADLTQDGRRLSKDEVYTVMLHEIGHALGLNHTDDATSVMYPGVNVIQEISKEDLKKLSDRYGW